MDRSDFDACFWTLGVVWFVLAGCSPLLLWGLGMHMGFGGTKTFGMDHWFGGHDYWYWYDVLPKYNPTTAWPLILGLGIILPLGYPLGAVAYKTADALRRAAR